MKLASLRFTAIAAFACALLNTTAAMASDTEVNGIYYDFDESSSTATVTYKGKCQCSGDAYKGCVTIPSSVTYDAHTYKVTAIGPHAFSSSRDLTSVVIPTSVEEIEIGRAHV